MPERPPLPERGPLPESSAGVLIPLSAPATLRLRLIDDATDAPIAGSVELWMLSLPGNEDWRGGDVRERTLDVPAGGGGGTLSDVPTGRFRMSVRDATPALDDPPPFDVPAQGEVVGRVRLRVPVQVRVHPMP